MIEILYNYCIITRHPYNPETLKRKIAPLVRVRVWQGLETRPDMLMRPAMNGYNVDTIIKEYAILSILISFLKQFQMLENRTN